MISQNDIMSRLEGKTDGAYGTAKDVSRQLVRGREVKSER
jgi:hypothetical protein